MVSKTKKVYFTSADGKFCKIVNYLSMEELLKILSLKHSNIKVVKIQNLKNELQPNA